MRGIKFRAWDKDASKMILASSVKMTPICSEELNSLDKQASYLRYELMQYTGLKDRLGVEIYEGDIVESKCSRFLIDFRDGSFLLVHEPTCRAEDEGECKTDTLNKTSILILNIEVIGNIYENQELLQ